MTRGPRYGRRAFLRDLGHASFAVAVLGIGAAACGTNGGSEAADEPTDASTSSPTGGGSPGTAATDGQPAGGATAWHRVDLGFVSAYVLVRDGEAAVVDTGVEGSAGDIEAVLSDAGLGWDAVAHVILTHKHPDHVGSVAAVLESAPDAAVYAGEADIGAISSPRPITAVADGDDVFGLQVVATPGHTPGHISVLDGAGALLVAGDALNGSDGGVAGPSPEFSEDMETANESVRKLAALSFETALFGHGDPVEEGAGAQVAMLAEEL